MPGEGRQHRLAGHQGDLHLPHTRGFTIRGKPFYTAAIENILKSETYAGTAYFNCRDSCTKPPRPPEDWVRVPVPPIVTPKIFATIQRRLKSRQPTRTAPRAVNGPTLLTGLAKCDCCRSHGGERAGMMLRTGKSGQYRYPVCANRATRSVHACTAPQLRMDEVDELVLSDRQWLHLFVDEVVVGRSEITISGQNDPLLKGITGRPGFFWAYGAQF